MSPAPLPVDPLYDDQVGKLGKARDETLAGITGARYRGLSDYGFNEAEPGGALTFDPNNPFSRAALLKKNFDASRARTGLSLASGGQLYGGAYQNAQDDLNRGQLRSEDSLQKSLTSWLMENTGAATRANSNYDLDVSKADEGRAARALDNPLYSPTADAGSVGTAAGPVSSTPPEKGVNRTPWVTAGPGIKGTKKTIKKTPKGKVVTYSNTLKGP